MFRDPDSGQKMLQFTLELEIVIKLLVIILN